MQDIFNLLDTASHLSAPALFGLALVAIVKGWVIPRFTYDQVIAWVNALLSYADRSVTAFDKLADLALSQFEAASTERSAIRASIDQLRTELGPTPGPQPPRVKKGGS